MKTKLFSAVAAAALALSAVTAPVWAAVRGPWDGATEITGGANINAASMVFSYNQDGIGGKASEDKIYKVVGTVTSSSNNWINGGIQALDNMTIEFSVMFPDNGSKMRMAIAAYKENSTSSSTSDNANFIVLSPSEGMHVFGTADGNKVSGVTIEAGKWYHIACTIPGNGGKEYKFYVNGELKKTYNGSVSYGARYLRFGPVKNTDTGEDSTVYFDNIWGYGETASGAKVFDAAEVTPSEVTGVASGYDITGTTIKTPADTETTAADIIAAITTTDGTDDTVRLYDSTMTTEYKGTDVVTNAVLVVGAKNGREYETAYSYYTVVPPKFEASITTTSDASTVSSTITFTNNKYTSKPAILMMVVFDAEGRIDSIEYRAITLSGDSTETITASKTASSGTVKIFTFSDWTAPNAFDKNIYTDNFN